MENGYGSDKEAKMETTLSNLGKDYLFPNKFTN